MNVGGACSKVTEKTMRRLQLLGAPSDVNSSFLRGAAGAPALIRKALFSDSSNLASEHGGEIGRDLSLDDLGDLALTGGEAEFTCLQSAAAGASAPLLTLGGDHSITYPLVAGLAARHGPLNILHFDAHPDLYENFEDNRFSHASPFARIMEGGHACRLVQVGIRTMNAHCRAQAERYGVEVVPWAGFDPRAAPVPDGPLYVTIDLDGFDPAFCPGVSHHEPGGLSVRDAITMLHRIEAPVVGADIVEYNPVRDINEMTAYVAAKLVKELASIMAR
ncbi:MAG: arginase/agmatinase/formiminoglutamase [Alphaproteobacteria bacterium]|nr:MAG: arginase/agmatinase/formiminoglutamase [Caulobacteraceae bacterium]TPW07537.1 MAG: arginase/agmatinase/formiminoglutamase [Alphaproteobacteria bacterium]